MTEHARKILRQVEAALDYASERGRDYSIHYDATSGQVVVKIDALGAKVVASAADTQEIVEGRADAD